MSSDPDHYETLGVPKDANKAEIKHAFRKHVRKSHPDRPGGDKEKFQREQKAYAVLSDQKTREQYDRTGKDGNAVPTITQRAYEELASLFSTVFLHNLDNIESIDILETINIQIKGAMTDPRKSIIELQKRMQKILAAKSRMTHDNKNKAPDIFNNIIEAELSATKCLIATEARTITVYEKMLELSKDYVYEFDTFAAQERPKSSKNLLDDLTRLMELGR